MSVLFNFQDREAYRLWSALHWTMREKDEFVESWKRVVKYSWDTPQLTTSKGRSVALKFALRTRTSGDREATDHWSVMARKASSAILEGGSWVKRAEGTGQLKSLDNSRTKIPLIYDQIVAVHEFGHMLGWGDEYRWSSDYFSDGESALSRGMEIRPRHLGHLKAWADNVMRQNEAYDTR